MSDFSKAKEARELWERTAEQKPAFEVREPGPEGHAYLVFSNGRTEGFPEGRIILNRVHLLERMAYAAGREEALARSQCDLPSGEIQPCDGCKHLMKPATRGASPYCTAAERETVDWLSGRATVARVTELLSVMRGKDGACGRSAKLREPA